TDEFSSSVKSQVADSSTTSNLEVRQMPRTVLLVGTRKGCFVLESDDDRRDWALRGPYCEGWPVYHATFDPDTGAIFAAAASEWHGAPHRGSPHLGAAPARTSGGANYRQRGGKRSEVGKRAGG